MQPVLELGEEELPAELRTLGGLKGGGNPRVDFQKKGPLFILIGNLKEQFTTIKILLFKNKLYFV